MPPPPEAHTAGVAGSVSEWVRRWSHLVPAGARVLDLACGSGRHVRWFAQRGCRVTGVDRDVAALQALQGLGEMIAADLERAPWPLAQRRFDAVVVTNYLWRPGLNAVLDCLDDGAVLIYETFSVGQESLGKPSNPDFLLRPGELLQRTQGLRVVAYEDGFETRPARFVQRIVAMRDGVAHSALTRHRLDDSHDGPGQVKSADCRETP